MSHADALPLALLPSPDPLRAVPTPHSPADAFPSRIPPAAWSAPARRQAVPRISPVTIGEEDEPPLTSALPLEAFGTAAETIPLHERRRGERRRGPARDAWYGRLAVGPLSVAVELRSPGGAGRRGDERALLDLLREAGLVAAAGDEMPADPANVVEVLAFTDADEVDPRLLERPWVLVPRPGARRGYATLREALRRSGTAAVARLPLRGRTRLALVVPVGGALLVEVLRRASGVASAAELPLPEAAEARKRDVRLAREAIQALRTGFDATASGGDAHLAAGRGCEGRRDGVGEALTLLARLRDRLDEDDDAPRRGARRRGRG